MIAFLYHWFDFPDGSVLTNLIASAVCVAFAGWRIVKHINKHFARIHDHLGLIHAHQVANTPAAKTRKPPRPPADPSNRG